jgi:hypothetical protein
MNMKNYNSNGSQMENDENNRLGMVATNGTK